MQNAEDWHASKYVVRNDRLSPTRDPMELSPGSRLIASLVAAQYERALPVHARGRLVDLGCGKAPLYGFYRNLVSEVVRVDWPSGRHGDRYVDCACDLNRGLPFADATVDTIVLSDVLEHLADPSGFCREIARILAPQGTVLMNVPFLYPIHERPHDYFRYTDIGLTHLVRDAGLTLIELTSIGGSLEVLVDLLAKRLVRIPLLGATCAIVMQEVVLGWRRTRFGAQTSPGTSEPWTLGYFAVARKEAGAGGSPLGSRTRRNQA